MGWGEQSLSGTSGEDSVSVVYPPLSVPTEWDLVMLCFWLLLFSMAAAGSKACEGHPGGSLSSSCLLTRLGSNEQPHHCLGSDFTCLCSAVCLFSAVCPASVHTLLSDTVDDTRGQHPASTKEVIPSKLDTQYEGVLLSVRAGGRGTDFL